MWEESRKKRRDTRKEVDPPKVENKTTSWSTHQEQRRQWSTEGAMWSTKRNVRRADRTEGVKTGNQFEQETANPNKPAITEVNQVEHDECSRRWQATTKSHSCDAMAV